MQKKKNDSVSIIILENWSPCDLVLHVGYFGGAKIEQFEKEQPLNKIFLYLNHRNVDPNPSKLAFQVRRVRLIFKVKNIGK